MQRCAKECKLVQKADAAKLEIPVGLPVYILTYWFKSHPRSPSFFFYRNLENIRFLFLKNPLNPFKSMNGTKMIGSDLNIVHDKHLDLKDGNCYVKLTELLL